MKKIIAIFMAIISVLIMSTASFSKENEAKENTVSVLISKSGCSKVPEETVKAYFSELYRSYLEMKPIRLFPLIDITYRTMANIEKWNAVLQMRRKIISDNDYCFVETKKKAYSINFITEEELCDIRMEKMDFSEYGSDAVILHFIISGTKGEAYPPLFALNSEHTVVLKKNKDGEYRIVYHYFPGSEGNFENDLDVDVIPYEDMEKRIKWEFSDAELTEPEALYKKTYDGEEAAKYALKYCEEAHEAFAKVNDWYGNCMNFASQCVWSGFNGCKDEIKYYTGMTKEWYCNKKKGGLCWTSVSRFWDWMNGEKCEMQTVSFRNVANVKNGDIVNVARNTCEEPQKFTHALIVVDDEKLLLAQNSPACFVCYSDLANFYFRFIRPVSMKK